MRAVSIIANSTDPGHSHSVSDPGHSHSIGGTTTLAIPAPLQVGDRVESVTASWGRPLFRGWIGWIGVDSTTGRLKYGINRDDGKTTAATHSYWYCFHDEVRAEVAPSIPVPVPTPAPTPAPAPFILAPLDASIWCIGARIEVTQSNYYTADHDVGIKGTICRAPWAEDNAWLCEIFRDDGFQGGGATLDDAGCTAWTIVIREGDVWHAAIIGGSTASANAPHIMGLSSEEIDRDAYREFMRGL